MRVILVSLLGLCLNACSGTENTRPTPATVVKQVTFIKTIEGVENHRVSDFIKKHWYEMDRRGVEAGIFTEYELTRCAPDSELCDFAMIVGYPQDQGYSDLNTQQVFMAIRAAHEEQYPEARELRAVMSIVGSETLSSVVDENGD